MSIEQIKEEIRRMPPEGLRQLSTYLLQVRRTQDPARKQQIADLIDSPRERWVSLDEFERQTTD